MAGNKGNFDESKRRAGLARAGKVREENGRGPAASGRGAGSEGKRLILSLLICAVLLAAASLWLLLGAEGDVFIPHGQAEGTEPGAESTEPETEGTEAGTEGTEPGAEGTEPGAEKVEAGAGLEVIFPDVGQGACVLIKADGQTLLVDGGPDSRGTWLQRFLKQQGVERLDYVIGTHFDADHIGALDVAVYKFDCGTVLLPDYEKNTKTARDLNDTLKARDIVAVHPAVGDTYPLGSGEFTVIAPGNSFYEAENDYSIGIIVRYKDMDIILTGDASELSEKEMLASGIDLRSDIYYVGHHGSSGSSSKAFLEAVNPKMAVISCGRDNDYGHPHEATLKRLEKQGAVIYRTDTQGSIIVRSDGSDDSWTTEVVPSK